MTEFVSENSSLSDKAGSPSHNMLQQAAQWFATIHDETVTASQKQAWANWLQQHPQHQQAWQYVENVGQRFQKAAQIGGQGDVSSTLKTVRADRVSRRHVLQGVSLCVVGWLSWRFTPMPRLIDNYTLAWRADHHTGIGETQKITLQDGGQLWLNTASAVNVSYQSDVRAISLLSGEILIETATDTQQRPFVVSTEQGRMQALGTRFTVRHQEGSTFLAVYDGAVKVETTGGATQIINTGEQTTFDQQNIKPIVVANRAREEWAQGVIVADNMSLEELVTEVSRYRHGHLAVAPEVANLRVMGTYPIDQPDHVLTMLEDALPVKARRLLPWWITLEGE